MVAVSAAILAAIGISQEAWNRLTPAQRKKIKAQYKTGAKGLAKAWAKTWAKKPTKKGKGKR